MTCGADEECENCQEKDCTYPKEKNMDKLLSFKEVCECVAKGEELQERDKYCASAGWSNMMSEYIHMAVRDYRRKPQEKWEPWNFETAPKCGEVLTDSDGDECMIVCKSEKGLFVGGDESIRFWDEVLNEYTHNGQKCGRRAE